MWILITAVATASLLGSMHCVGMCGPLAMWASGIGTSVSRTTIAASTSLYHLGRLTTYLLAGLFAGAVGNAVDLGGQLVGVQVAAARVVGVLMILIGAVKLWTLIKGRSTSALPLKPSRISGMLIRLRPYLFRLPPLQRGFATGLLTTLLPCGWLYLFALLAAATADPLMGMIVMAAFWVGTVPALTALVAGSQLLSRRFTTAIPIAAAMLLMLTGGYTALGRGFADLDSLAKLQAAVAIDQRDPDSDRLLEQVERTTSQPLPCCVQEP